jgi:16S rRNA (guanine1516-N2)-methyltransferase
MTIAVYYSSQELEPRAEALALTLALPITSEPHGYDYLLTLTSSYLGLQKVGSRSSPLFIDFLSPKIRFRLQQASFKNERLVRALGLKKNTRPFIVDATGGLGRDSILLANLGFEVTMLERSPIIHALLLDGIERAKSQLPAIHRLSLIHTDAISWLSQLSPNNKPDIIYLDPMFEERKNSALPKKEMLIFHDVVGEDTDAQSLLLTALTCARQRVVVKRPRLARPVGDIVPVYSSKGNSCRFDIYLI